MAIVPPKKKRIRNKPPIPQPPKVEVSQQISVNVAGDILQVLIPIRINDSFECLVSAGLDIAKMPDMLWTKVLECRSGIALAVPPPIKILH